LTPSLPVPAKRLNPAGKILIYGKKAPEAVFCGDARFLLLKSEAKVGGDNPVSQIPYCSRAISFAG